MVLFLHHGGTLAGTSHLLPTGRIQPILLLKEAKKEKHKNISYCQRTKQRKQQKVDKPKSMYEKGVMCAKCQLLNYSIVLWIRLSSIGQSGRNLEKLNPSNLCYLLNRPDQCSLKPATKLPIIIISVGGN